jgi:hypothetical protein
LFVAGSSFASNLPGWQIGAALALATPKMSVTNKHVIAMQSGVSKHERRVSKIDPPSVVKKMPAGRAIASGGARRSTAMNTLGQFLTFWAYVHNPRS